jgi:hypothetical protein
MELYGVLKLQKNLTTKGALRQGISPIDIEILKTCHLWMETAISSSLDCEIAHAPRLQSLQVDE